MSGDTQTTPVPIRVQIQQRKAAFVALGDDRLREIISSAPAIDDVAAIHGVSVPFVWQHCHRLGIDRSQRRFGPRPDRPRPRAVQYVAGSTLLAHLTEEQVRDIIVAADDYETAAEGLSVSVSVARSAAFRLRVQPKNARAQWWAKHE